MSFWLQSLSENGFDVFTLVYIAVLLIIYHYLMRWFNNQKFKHLEQVMVERSEKIEEMLLEIYDEVEK